MNYSLVTKTLATILFFLCLLYIYINFDWLEILDSLKNVDIYAFFLGSSVSIIIFWVLRAYRWWVFLRLIGVEHISFGSLYIVTAFSLGFSIITPLQSGELIKIELIKKIIPISRINGYATLALERIIDLSVVATLAAVGVLFGIPMNIYILVFLVLLAILGVLLIYKLYSSGKYDFIFSELDVSILLIKSRVGSVFQILLTTFLSWSCLALGWWWSIALVDIEIGALKALFITTSVTIINVISLIPGAIGVSEVSISAFLIYLGFEQNIANSAAIMIRIYGVLAIILGLLHIGFFYVIKSNDTPDKS